MVQHLIVPIDGSEEALRGVDVAASIARACDARIDLVEIVPTPEVAAAAEHDFTEAVESIGTTDLEVTSTSHLTTGTVADGIAELLQHSPEATVVMASHGRGRSAAVVGSVTDDLLQREFGPIVVVGPGLKAGSDQFDISGPVLVAVDGSEASEEGVPLAGAWAIELGVMPWIIEVADPDHPVTGDVLESSYAARLAAELRKESGHEVQYDVLHGHNVAETIADYARQLGASFLVATTHGRTGMARFTMGSVAAGIVRHAPCPVILLRPPRLQT